MGTVFDDVVLRQLEQQYKGAIPIIYCTLNEKRCKGWSGFVVSKLPMIILTVSHGVRHYNNNLLEAESSFYVKFYADCNYYRADAIRWDHRSDLLVLTCQRPAHDPSPLSFVDPDLPFSTSTSLFSISTAGDREWRMIRGSVCSPPFLKGQYPLYHHDLTQFDHDVQLYPGGSGAALIDLMGQVFGMQTSEITCKEHVFCVAKDARKRIGKYTEQDVAGIYRTINELVFRPSNLKQATPVHELAKRLKEMFLEDGIDPHTGLTSFLRQSVNIFILRKKEAQGTPTESPAPSPATSSGQDPQSSTHPSKKPRLHERGKLVLKRQSLLSPVLSVTDTATAGSQAFQPWCSNGFFDNNEKLAQRLCAPKQVVPSGSTRPIFVLFASRNGIPVATEKEASEEDKILPSGVEPVLWQPGDCEGGNNDLATVAVDPLLVKYLGPCKREGVQFFLECVSGLCSAPNIHGFILAVDMSLGNTLQSFILLHQGFDGNPVVREAVYATPTNLILSKLEAEIKKRVGEQVRLVTTHLPPKDEFACLLSSIAGGCGRNPPVLFDPSWNPANGKQAAARVWRDGLKDRVYFFRLLRTGIIEEEVYQCQKSEEILQKFIQKEQIDLKNQGNFLLAEVLKDLFSLHENVRSRVGMVDYMPEGYGEQDEVSLANVNCQSDQEDMGAVAGITGCLHMFNSSEKQIRMVLNTKEKMITKRDPDGLLASKPIQVYIMRANPSSQIDGPTGFLNLGACVRGIDNDYQEKDLEITEMAREKHLERYSPCHTVQEREWVALSNKVDGAGLHEIILEWC